MNDVALRAYDFVVCFFNPSPNRSGCDRILISMAQEEEEDQKVYRRKKKKLITVYGLILRRSKVLI